MLHRSIHLFLGWNTRGFSVRFSFVVTLGEHGCEWFQIWLDGDLNQW